MNKKILELQKLKTFKGENTEKSNLSIICNQGDGSSISLHICTSIAK
ncbi:class III lanthipeptide [Staphylococcus coagulans]|nr:class III lanthipeptide [Staphylococcus pseudintermedius]MDF0070684.1 class III lanthipeptide [Staphylococcus pseudintermedius]MDF0082665.1 class III lanthipeptide [Staphylococcus pseudintermedius]